MICSVQVNEMSEEGGTNDMDGETDEDMESRMEGGKGGRMEGRTQEHMEKNMESEMGADIEGDMGADMEGDMEGDMGAYMKGLMEGDMEVNTEPVLDEPVNKSHPDISMFDNFALREPYDRIIRCLGFSFNDSLFLRWVIQNVHYIEIYIYIHEGSLVYGTIGWYSTCMWNITLLYHGMILCDGNVPVIHVAYLPIMPWCNMVMLPMHMEQSPIMSWYNMVMFYMIVGHFYIMPWYYMLMFHIPLLYHCICSNDEPSWTVSWYSVLATIH